MGKLLTIFLFFSFAANGQLPVVFYGLNGVQASVYVPPAVVSNLKNPQIIPNGSGTKQYVAFGNNINLGSDTTTLSDTTILFTRMGASHIDGGLAAYNIYHISTDTWDGYHVMRTDTADNRDGYGTKMDNDSIIYWSCLSFNDATNAFTGSPIGGTTQIYQIRMGRNLGQTDTINFRWPTVSPRLQRSFIYGKATYLDSPGHYATTLLTYNVDTGNLSRVILYVLKTTDYFRTYWLVRIWDNTLDGSGSPDETAISYLGSGRVGLWTRLFQGSQMYYTESSNYGNTWTFRGNADSLWWYKAGGDMQASIYRIGKKDSIYITYGNRDNDCIEISLNRPSDFFGSHFFKRPEIYFYNRSEDAAVANSSLNYTSVSMAIRDSIFLMTYYHEKAPDTAYAYYSRDDFKTDPLGIPTAPTLTISGTTTTAFRVDVTGYTQAQKNNIRAFYFDLSTDPAFGSFVTAKYQSPTTTSAVSLNNIYMHAFYDIFNGLTTGTTYYFRARACNNAGCSSYTTQMITTL
jgi:hypothetical protein